MQRLSRLIGFARRWPLGQWALRTIGPAILVVLLVRVVDYGELRAAVADLHLPWALAALVTVHVTMLLRTVRWIDIHNAFGLQRTGFGYHLRVTYATGFASVVMPQVVNPLSRLVLMVQDGFRARPLAAGLVLDKGMELAAFVVFGLYGSIVLASVFGGLVWWAAGIAVALVTAVVAAYMLRRYLRALAALLLERLPELSATADVEPAEAARSAVNLGPSVLARVATWSLLIALAQATMLYFLAESLGVGLSYPFMIGAWGVIGLSMLLPISVNGLGTREAVLVGAFSAADRSTDAAVALGLLVLATVAVGTAPGAIEWLARFVLGRAAEGEQLAVATPAQEQQY